MNVPKSDIFMSVKSVATIFKMPIDYKNLINHDKLDEPKTFQLLTELRTCRLAAIL